MLEHVYERAQQTTAEQVVVATDDERIADFCTRRNMHVLMTNSEHPSGTDRIAEVANIRQWQDDEIVIGLQGDEPATPPGLIEQLARNLAARPEADIATLCTPVTSANEYHDSNRVKVVFDEAGYALYFSRASIPHRRERADQDDFPAAYIHIGMYAYRARFLRAYLELEAHVLEQEERLEQLRALANGYRIHVDIAHDVPAHGVDRPEDVDAIEKILLNGN